MFYETFPSRCCIVRVSSCNVYAVQLDTQYSYTVEFYSQINLLHNVSDLMGPSSGASNLRVRIW
jgi:hypothetical protein